MTCFRATQKPSGVYASSRSCSTRRTSATFFVASSSANDETPLPMTSALTALEVSLAICCAATSVSKLALFHLPWRCSVTTRIFMLDHPRFKLELFDELRRHFFGRAGQEFCFLRFCGHVNLFDFLRRFVRDAQRFTRDGCNFLFLRSHDALERRVAHFVDARLNGEHRRQRALHPLKPTGFELPLELHLSVLHVDLHDDRGVRAIELRSEKHAGLTKAMVITLQPG